MDLPLPSAWEIIPTADIQAFGDDQEYQAESASTPMGQDSLWASMAPEMPGSFNDNYLDETSAAGVEFHDGPYSGVAPGRFNSPGPLPAHWRDALNYRGVPLGGGAGSGQGRNSVPAGPWANASYQASYTPSSRPFTPMSSGSSNQFNGSNQVNGSRIVVGDPLVKLEPGEFIESCSLTSDHPKGSVMLGSLNLDSFGEKQVLFNFGVLSIMARLNPQFHFKYGGDQGRQVGLRLTLFGHTIVVKPSILSAHECKVVGCRAALEKLREFHPHWLVAPVPKDGPTGAEWNWVRLLEDYCRLMNCRAPKYGPLLRDNEWTCELRLNSRVFTTASVVGTLYEAQNTVAHITLYELLTDEFVSLDIIEPAKEPQFVIKTRESAVNLAEVQARDLVPPVPKPPSAPSSAETVETLIPGGSSGGNGSNRRKRGGKRGGRGRRGGQGNKKPDPQRISAQNPIFNAAPKADATPLQFTTSKVSTLKVFKSSKETDRATNYVPVVNRRWNPLQGLEEPEVVDPLATLKVLEKELVALARNSSYWTILIRTCSVLKCNVPEIRLEKDTAGNRPHERWMIRAWFDTSHAYLCRASPILLQGNIPEVAARKADSYGVKKIILFLIRMMGEDTLVNNLEEGEVFSFRSHRGFDRDLPTIVELEREIESVLRNIDIESFVEKIKDVTRSSRGQ